MAALSISPIENGSMNVTITFDRTPQSLYWSLKDADGTVINDRTEEEVESPTTEEIIKLAGDDLLIFTDEPLATAKRYFYIWGTYLDEGDPYEFSREREFTIEETVSLSPSTR